MKKIIAMILTLTMMLCMAVFAFALSGPTEKITGMVQGLSHGYSASGGDAVLNEVNPQDERVEYIYLYDRCFIVIRSGNCGF